MKKGLLIITLFIAGFFCKAQSWYPLGEGMSAEFFDVAAYVNTLTVYNDNLIAGGNFYSPFSNIAQWNGTSWSTLGSGIQYNFGSNKVEALAVYDGQLIAGGDFDSAGGNPANYIAQWNGTSWSAINGINQQVTALILFNGNLIAGGYFDTAGGIRANYIAVWNGTSWSALGSGMNGGVSALTIYNGNLIAGGGFDSAGGVPAKNIAQWNGTSWSPLGSGINSYITALTVYNSNLYVGGQFDTAGGNPANNIAEWTGTAWLALGAGILGGDYTCVYALTIYNGNLIASGEFDSAGGNPANNIADWNGTSWSAIGSGMNYGIFPPYIYALAVYNGNLYAGGAFDTAGGIRANYIAEWCPGSCPAGINEITENDGVSIYPNPSNGVFNIVVRNKEQEITEVEVYNVLGEKVYSQPSTFNSQLSINLSNQPNGIYLYRVLSETGNLVSQGKLIIQK